MKLVSFALGFLTGGYSRNWWLLAVYAGTVIGTCLLIIVLRGKGE